jgi:hypothetical protein
MADEARDLTQGLSRAKNNRKYGSAKAADDGKGSLPGRASSGLRPPTIDHRPPTTDYLPPTAIFEASMMHGPWAPGGAGKAARKGPGSSAPHHITAQRSAARQSISGGGFGSGRRLARESGRVAMPGDPGAGRPKVGVFFKLRLKGQDETGCAWP